MLSQRTATVSEAIANLKADLTTAKVAARDRVIVAQALTAANEVNDADLKTGLNAEPTVTVGTGTWSEWLLASADTNELAQREGLAFKVLGSIRQDRATNLTTAIAAARTSLTTLKGTIDDGDLKTKINVLHPDTIDADNAHTWLTYLT